MATLKIITNSNADAVWVWELVKRLGYEVEVVFDCSDNIQPNYRPKLLQKDEIRQLLNEVRRNSPKESRFVRNNDSNNKRGNNKNRKNHSKIRK